METPPSAPRVRIVVRTHDRPQLLARALDDIVEQSYQEWQMVIINHRGDRATLDDVVKARADRFPHECLIVDSDHPIGRDAIIGLGIADADTEYVAIHDDDDTWAPDFLTRTVSWLDTHPEHVAVAVKTDIIQERVDQDGVIILSQTPIRPPFARVSLFDLVHAAHVPPIGYLFRRSAIESAGGFDATLSVLGDWDLMLRLAVDGQIGYLDGETLAYWRQRPQSEGALANSVIGDLDLHRQTDRELRDRALREYIERNGIGGLLYIARYADELYAQSRHEAWLRAREVEAHVTERIEEQTKHLEAMIAQYAHHYSVFPSLRRAMSRVFHPRRGGYS
ncbi:glycosyltransferase family 2 protein [Microbacterium sp. NEAU-LLC]|uniref:Glycosyltransferase family 2 protein n=1 Tax=Microbacterium helvum TaxID=2773713 RepID=A0ABR8NMY8_9MICO|nr:glycosyltransferase family 2 protein [Microbacterium helvum]